MEGKHYVFYQLVNLCYKANKSRNGLLIFPIYSPRKLGFIKSEMTKNKHIFNYSKELVRRLESDLKKYTGNDKKLFKHENILLEKLVSDGLLSENKEAPYDIKKYNTITTRFRIFWLNYFLKQVYKYNHSFNTFNIWVERGKQLGIIHTTEFYPNFDGRLVYPTSIITKNVRSTDFDCLFKYQTGEKLYSHKPDWNKKMKGHNASEAQEAFVKQLVESYYDLKKSRRTHFIRLPDLREKVCYKMRIPSFIFDSFLEKTYMLNIKGEMILKVQISLEADRLPQENNAMYLRREPVLINGKYKNIIAIDYQKK